MKCNARRWPSGWQACLAMLGCLLTDASSAQTSDRQARVWAASCATCHETDGRAQGAIPGLAGKDGEALYRSLLEFKSNQRPAATVMHQHTKGYSDDELRRIALYIASQPAAAR